MSVELIYKTSDPAAVAWMSDIIEKRKVAREKRKAYGARVLEEFGPRGRRYSYMQEEPADERRDLYVGRYHAFGIDSGIDEKPPAESGWRLDAKGRYWKPKLATKRGKERAAELRELSMPEPDTQAVGWDSMHWGNSYMYWPAFMLREELGEVWVAWGAYECREALSKDSPVAWTEVPRSEWHAWREAVEAGESQEALT